MKLQYNTGIRYKKRVLVFIPAFYAENLIGRVIERIPASLLERYEVDVLVSDDSSGDSTFAQGYAASKREDLPFSVRVLFNPSNQGYGGNQKIGYRYAIDSGYDFVALVHGDGQYAPECLPELLAPFDDASVAAVFGSRMISPGGARRGGMPLYKLLGNRTLTWIQNRLLGSDLSEFHTGYRIYSVRALASIPFERNSNGFHFDTEIIIQLLIAKLEIRELPIPTHYGDEICRVNGPKYAVSVILACLRARLQELGIFYDRRYDCGRAPLAHYKPKLEYKSPHSIAYSMVPAGARVLDLGCAGGYMGQALKEGKSCFVTGVDAFEPDTVSLDEFYLRDLNQGLTGIPVARHDFILFLDVIEHLASPERFLDQLYESLESNPKVQILMSTANIGFFIQRLMLLAGEFNYGKRGILDLTHTRLFTFRSFRNVVEQAGFDIHEMKAVPAPFPMALGNNWFSRFLVSANAVLTRLSKGLFAYQIFAVIRPRPSVAFLLGAATEESAKKVKAIETAVET